MTEDTTLTRRGFLKGAAATLGLVANPAVDLGNVAQKAFDEFFRPGQNKIEETINPYGLNQAYAQDLGGLDGKVDTTTYWTPEKLRLVINEPKLSFIYWREEGAKYTNKGDRFFRDFMNDFGSEFDNIILMEATKYGKNLMLEFGGVLNELNPAERKYTNRNPTYSIVGFGKEVRIRGPPEGDERSYQSNYRNIYKNPIAETIKWFKAQKLQKTSSPQ